MGHRTLVAYRQTDGSFALHYAHWGQDLASDVTAGTPFGGPAGPSEPTRVDPRPVGTGLDAGAVLAAVDPNVESLVVVSPRFETTPYLVCSLDPLAGARTDRERRDGPEADRDDLVLARPDDSPAALRSWFVERKSAVSAAVGAGTLTPSAGRDRLRDALDGRATLFSPDDASFLRTG